MAQFAAWWEPGTLTGVEDAARSANVLVSAGEYTIAALDLGDGGDQLAVSTPGVVIAAHGTTWLLYPQPAPEQCWIAQQVHHTPDRITPAHEDPVVLAGPTETSGAAIVAALVDGRHRNAAAARFARLQDTVLVLQRLSDEMRMAGDPHAQPVTRLAANARQVVEELASAAATGTDL